MTDTTHTALLEGAQSYFRTAFDGVIRIELENPSTSLWVDGRVIPPLISIKAPQNVDGAYCLWRAGHETIQRLFSLEERRLDSAYIAGRLHISGDMSVMMRLEAGAPRKEVHAE